MTDEGKKYVSFGLAEVLVQFCRGYCKDCNSLGCFVSPNYKHVARWRCYQKKYQNEKV